MDVLIVPPHGRMFRIYQRMYHRIGKPVKRQSVCKLSDIFIGIQVDELEKHISPEYDDFLYRKRI